jgi:hypothetical protein
MAAIVVSRTPRAATLPTAPFNRPSRARSMALPARLRGPEGRAAAVIDTLLTLLRAHGAVSLKQGAKISTCQTPEERADRDSGGASKRADTSTNLCTNTSLHNGSGYVISSHLTEGLGDGLAGGAQ